MTQPFIGPFPPPELPPQPEFGGWCTNWNAYDVPRIWDIVRLENDKLGWEQVNGFRQLADLLIDHYRRLITQRAILSSAWQSPAGHEVIERVDTFAKALLSDANCAAITANALDIIMDTYAKAQRRVSSLMQEWNVVTTDWTPEWWDTAAERLNNRARQIMVETDKIVREHKSNIVVPDSISASSIAQGGSIDALNEPFSPIPPVPGYDPIVPAQTDARLAGIGGSSSVSPGQAVSMLPVPPGSQYAPYGGAYILPGPGVGAGGYIVAMPHPSNRTGGAPAVYYPGTVSPNAGGNALAGTVGASTPSLVPLGMGSPPQTPTPGPTGPRNPPNTKWEQHGAVLGVIHGIDKGAYIPDRPSREQEDEFRDWFASLSHSSRDNEPSGSEGRIVLRKAKE